MTYSNRKPITRLEMEEFTNLLINAEGSCQSYLHGINQIVQGGCGKPLGANSRCLQKGSVIVDYSMLSIYEWLKSWQLWPYQNLLNIKNQHTCIFFGNKLQISTSLKYKHHETCNFFNFQVDISLHWDKIIINNKIENV